MPTAPRSAPRRRQPAMSSSETAMWRQRLRAIRANLVDDLVAVEHDALSDENPQGDPTAVAQPLEVELAEADNTRALLADVDAALAKLDGKGRLPFGVCEITGERIEPDRLDLVPWTRCCAAAARRPA